MNSPLLLTLRAADFAARAHSRQRRKDEAATPYINHLMEVALLLAQAGARVEVIAAGFLHDTVEDAEVTPEELAREFSEEIAALVMGVTDDKTLERSVRKEQQVERAKSASREIGMIKLADKISNLRALRDTPPISWASDRRAEYVAWAHRVVISLPERDPVLMAEYEKVRAAHSG
jgi:(p)ppGpp synthase/HD superfamily hydrolase